MYGILYLVSVIKQAIRHFNDDSPYYCTKPRRQYFKFVLLRQANVTVEYLHVPCFAKDLVADPRLTKFFEPTYSTYELHAATTRAKGATTTNAPKPTNIKSNKSLNS